MKRIINPIVGVTGTATTFSLAHANEVLAFVCGLLTAAYMLLKIYGAVQKQRRKNNQQPELDLDLDTDL